MIKKGDYFRIIKWNDLHKAQKALGCSLSPVDESVHYCESSCHGRFCNGVRILSYRGRTTSVAEWEGIGEDYCEKVSITELKNG